MTNPRTCAAKPRSIRSDRSAGVATLVAVLMPVLIGFAALAIDAVSWELSDANAQAAADQAALSAGIASTTSDGNITTEGQGVAATNGFVNGTGGVTVTVSEPPVTGAHKGVAGAIEVTITKPQTLTLSRLFLAGAPTVSAYAVVSVNAGACVIALATSGTGVATSGNTNVDLKNCNFDNNSTSSDGTELSGTGGISAQNVLLAGNYTSSGPTLTATDTLQTDGSAVADPYASRVVPTYSGCDQNTTTYTSSHTFTASPNPYVICGEIETSGSGTLTFGPGVYIFNNVNNNADLELSGTWTIDATNATLIFTNSTGSTPGTIQASGNTTFNLVAPTSGATEGLAIWITKGGASSLALSGGSTLNLTGAIYAPTSSVNLSGIGSSPCSQIVAEYINFSGNATLEHNCAGDGVTDGGVALVE